jgi:glycosyltransferase involved in cell wall biosynthesis
MSKGDAAWNGQTGLGLFGGSLDHELLSIVIPAYNEEKGIAAVIDRILKEREHIIAATEGWIQDVEIIVVNDASKDGTQEIVNGYTNVKLINLDENRGYGGALKEGFEQSRGALIAFLDADGTYPPEELANLCRALRMEEADMVIGSRMSGEKSRMPLARYIGNKFFAYFLSWIVGRKITDTASGMRVFRKEILPILFPLPNGLHLTPAMSTQALHQGLKVVEIPIRYEERQGHSKLNVFIDGFRFLNIIISIARLYNPLKFFGLVGVFLILVALFLSLDPIVYYLQVRRVEDTEIYRLFTIMVLWVTGINVITFGAFSNYVLEIMHGRGPNRTSLIDRCLLCPQVIRKSGLFGAALMISAALLNHRTIYEYVTMGRIYVHWVYILTGATFFLVGLQISMGSILIGILEELKERERFHSS